MAIPDYQALMLPVLRLAAEGETSIADAVARMQDEFGLSEEERRTPLPSGRQAVITNRVHWPRTYLKQAGLLDAPRRGRFAISENGRRVLAERPERIDNAFLRRFETFNDFMGRRRGTNRSAPETPGPVSASMPEATPDETLCDAHARLIEALAADLLDHVRAASPRFFEKLVVNLLLAMGYGGSTASVERSLTPSTGDGGVDGVIDQDPLGLDRVYVQAKRYAPDVPVQVEQVRAFAGSLHGRGAGKGVFVTTSRFTAGARDEAERMNVRIVLIDGARLAELMIRHDVGCRPVETVVLKRIDEDFFDS
jgi:restriction system protein